MMKKPAINFTDWFPCLWDQAQIQGLDKGEWMKRSGIGIQRYAEFAIAAGIQQPREGNPKQRKRDVSATYFIMLVSGLGYEVNQIEKVCGKRLTEDQRERLTGQSWYKSREDLIVKAIKNKAVREAIDALIGAHKKT